MRLPYKDADPSHGDFQYLEDLATAYWYSEILFTTLELGIFKYLAKCPCSLTALVKETGWDRDGLDRFLATLVALGLLVEFDGMFANSPLADRYLVPGRDEYMGDFIEYRSYIAPHWQRLSTRIKEGIPANERPIDEPHEAYEKRVFNYVQAMDVQARFKAMEVLEYVDALRVTFPQHILDIGGGAGAWSRTFLKHWPQADAILFDLPEVLTAACKLYPDPNDWKGIQRVAGNILIPCLKKKKFSLIILSNILHVYGEKEAMEILQFSARCLMPEGLILIHDYLTDEHETGPQKGKLYDLHMMLNTFNGRIYGHNQLTGMLNAVGLKNSRTLQMRSDTWVVAARKGEQGHSYLEDRDLLTAEARRLGFCFASVIHAKDVSIQPWVKLKCRFGCPQYGKWNTCPPYAPDEDTIKEILSDYKYVLVVQGTPPAMQFHNQLLSLERSLFLSGCTKALAFGAGPCPVCPACVPDETCRFPEKARPSMEACGMDVYVTAQRAGIMIKPVSSSSGYVKYIGLILIN